MDGFFDQWGAQAEYVANNAIALRYMVFHPELTEPTRVQAFVDDLARKQYGDAAARHVSLAWREIEAAQQIQSNHTYYWHHLRPNWAGPTLRSPLTLDALRKCVLRGREPSKPHGKVDYCPHSDDEIVATDILGKALSKAAGHFRLAAEHIEAALETLDPDHRSQCEHWYAESTSNMRSRLTPRKSLEKQLGTIQTHAKNQRIMGHFFAAYSLVKSMPKEGQPGYKEAMVRLRAIQEAASACRASL